MERVIARDDFGNIACNGIIIYSNSNANLERDISDFSKSNWIIIKPKYYIDKEDDMIFEIWYDRTGIILDRGLNTYIKNDEIANDWNLTTLREINKESAMIKYKERLLREERLTELDAKGINAEPIKQQNNGGSSDWYLLPDNAKTLQDLIEHRNMNGAVKDIFKACYRLGIKTEDELRDLNKMAYYSLREIGRITSRKDYITIAKELMGSQAVEKE